jgi:S1-C subfamily serine protease
MCRRGAYWLALVVLAAVLLAGCSSLAPLAPLSTPTPPSAADLQQNVVDVINTVQPSVVEIESRGGQGVGIGSGVVLTSDGYIVTNDHVVRGFTSFTVRFGEGQAVQGQLVGEAPQDDLAVIKVGMKQLRTISLGDSSKVEVGQFAIAVGNPLGLEGTATFGIVSAINRSASESPNGPASTLIGLIQTSAPINPGNSGGALVDLQGQLIGIPTLAAVDPQVGAPANGIGFAIPSNRVKFVTQQLIQYGKLTHTGQGLLGIEGQTVTPELAAVNDLPAQSGVLIAGFVKDTSGKSPAQQAGLRVGDVIVQVDGKAIASSDDLAALTLGQQPGTKAKVTVARKGANQSTIQVTLGERPAGP